MNIEAPYPFVSFIVPTLNEEYNLPRCLTSIWSQTYPKGNIEIIVADAGSSDKTTSIAKKFRAKVIHNPEILHEHGKTRALKVASGEIIFFTDADNVLASSNWLLRMTKPYIENKSVVGFLPQTMAPSDTNALDTYLGYLCTDPFTWFVYGQATSPRDYNDMYVFYKKTRDYTIYRFPIDNHPLIGLSQGFGIQKQFKRTQDIKGDDILAAIRIIEQNGLIAYVPKAGIYHYHVDGFWNFYKKYRWRIKNNLLRKYKETGLVSRMKYHSIHRKIRMLFFVPYGLSIILPFIDAIRLSKKFNNPVLFLHVPATFILALVIIKEFVLSFIPGKKEIESYV